MLAHTLQRVAAVAYVAVLVAACAGTPTSDQAAPTPSAAFANPEYILSAEELAAQLEQGGNLVLLDARAANDYGAGHIPGATSLPASSLDRDGGEFAFQVRPPGEIAPLLQAAGISDDSTTVIYDAGRSFNAARVWWVLDYYGHADIAVLDGGLQAWEAAGGASDTRQPSPAPGDFTPVPDAGKIADYDYVLEHLGTDATAICDARRAADYQQAAIPGAVSLPYDDTYDGGLVKDAEELQSLFDDVGLTPDREIVFYCIGGYLSSHDFLLSRALGYENVRLYDGSITEWNARSGPTEADAAN